MRLQAATPPLKPSSRVSSSSHGSNVRGMKKVYGRQRMPRSSRRRSAHEGMKVFRHASRAC